MAKADGHDAPGLRDEFVPGIAAVIDDVERKTRLESRLSRMNCQMVSTCFNSVHLEGSGMSVMFGGRCHLAWSISSTRRARGARRQPPSRLGAGSWWRRASGKHEPCAFAEPGADCAEDVGRGRAL